jgi:hypothetical protein
MSDEPAPVLQRCVLCQHPLVESINRRIRDHGLAETIRWMESQKLQTPHRNTFSTHKRFHMTSDYERQREQATKALEEQQRTIKSKPGDLASLVRDSVYARVEAGVLEPTIAEGLRAQEALDRRMERGADREMLVTLAGLLSGAAQPVALLADGNTIEGDFREVDDEAREDRETFAALLG